MRSQLATRTILWAAACTLLLAPHRAGAIAGDVWPRGAPDGAITLGDAFVASAIARGALAPTTEEARDADVTPGDFTDAIAEPPLFTPTGDAAVDDTDAVALLDAVVGGREIGPRRELKLLSSSDFALTDEPYTNTAFLNVKLNAPAKFRLEGAPPGMSIDPATGTVSFVPSAGQVGKLAFTVVAETEEGENQIRTSFEIDVQRPMAQGKAMITTDAGGTVEVTDPTSSIPGSKFSVGPGVAPDDEELELSTVDRAAGWTPGSMAVSPPIVPPQGKPFQGETELTVAYDDGALPDGADEQDLAVGFFQPGKFGDTVDGQLRAGWVFVPAELDTAGNEIRARLNGELEGLARVFALPMDPACPVDNDGERVRVLVDSCPGDFSPTDVRDAVEVALDTYEALGLDVPESVVVFIEDLDDGQLGTTNPTSPTVLHLDRDLTLALMRTTSAHEVFHLVQYRMLGAQFNEISFEDNLYVTEGTAVWMEEVVWDALNPYLLKGNRVSPSYPRFPIDERSARTLQFTLFNYLVTAQGFDVGELFRGDRSDYANPGGGARAIDDILGAGAPAPPPGDPSPLIAAYLDLVHAHGTRDPDRIDEIDGFGFPPPRVIEVPPTATAESPVTLRPAGAFPHLSGRALAFEIPENGGSEVFVRIAGDAAVRGALHREGETEPFLEFEGGDRTLELGAIRGRFVLVVVNPRLVAGPERSLEVTAWRGCDVEIVIAEPDEGEEADRTVTVKGSVPEAAELGVTAVRASTEAGSAVGNVRADGSFVVRDVPLAPGRNFVEVVARSADGACRGAATVLVVTPNDGTYLIAELTWNLDAADVDLSVTQPDGDVLWRGDLFGAAVDSSLSRNDTGFGPETYAIRRDLGAGEPFLEGDYEIRVHYFDDLTGRPARAVRWTLVVTLFRGTLAEERRSFTGTITTADPGDSEPAGEGPSWSEPVVVNVEAP